MDRPNLFGGSWKIKKFDEVIVKTNYDIFNKGKNNILNDIVKLFFAILKVFIFDIL